MRARLNYAEVAPNALKAMLELEKYVHSSGLEHLLYELVKTRASQINGCAYCLVAGQFNRNLKRYRFFDKIIFCRFWLLESVSSFDRVKLFDRLSLWS